MVRLIIGSRTPLGRRGIPGHALHDKVYARQVGVGPLVSNRKRRALLAPQIRRGSIADFVPPSVYNWISFCSCIRRIVRDICAPCLRGQRGQLSLGRSDSSVPVLPGCAPPRCSAVRRPDPTRIWYVRVLGSTNLKESIASPQRSHGNNREPKLPVGHGARYGFLFVESKTRTYHGRIGAGRRTAEQRGGAE